MDIEAEANIKRLADFLNSRQPCALSVYYCWGCGKKYDLNNYWNEDTQELNFKCSCEKEVVNGQKSLDV